MRINPKNHTLIVRIQAEYSASSQTKVVRYVLENPSSGERRGFAELETLLCALRIELTKIANPIVAPEQKEEKPEDDK